MPARRACGRQFRGKLCARRGGGSPPVAEGSRRPGSAVSRPPCPALAGRGRPLVPVSGYADLPGPAILTLGCVVRVLAPAPEIPGKPRLVRSGARCLAERRPRDPQLGPGSAPPIWGRQAPQGSCWRTASRVSAKGAQEQGKRSTSRQVPRAHRRGAPGSPVPGISVGLKAQNTCPARRLEEGLGKV